MHKVLDTMVKRHNDRVHEVENFLNAESRKKLHKGGKAGSPPSPLAGSPPSGGCRRVADYDFNNPQPYALVGNGLGATVWPDRPQGVDSLYDTLKMSAIRL